MIQNHSDGYHHYQEKVRQYRYELVDGVIGDIPVYGLIRYADAPILKHRGFYHVKESLLGEVWWKRPSAPQQIELVARYPDIMF